MTFAIRTARSEEYDLIGELTVAVYLKDDLVNPASTYFNILRDAADRGHMAELVVAELAGEIVGSVAYCPPDSPYAELAALDEAEFRMLAVRDAARGRGIGSALVQECIDRAKSAGFTGIRLSTQRNMQGAHRIYERIGFKRTPDRDWSPLPGVNLITYFLSL